MRTWAFCDGNRPGALQRNAGQLDEATFRALDAVMAQAQARNIRLLLTLTNNWRDYGAHTNARRVGHAQTGRCVARRADCPRDCGWIAAGGINEYISWARSAGEQLYGQDGARWRERRRCMQHTYMRTDDVPLLVTHPLLCHRFFQVAHLPLALPRLLHGFDRAREHRHGRGVSRRSHHLRLGAHQRATRLERWQRRHASGLD